MQQPRPLCKSERHNLFWDEEKLIGPKDAYATIEQYGIFEFRRCIRCGRHQKRFQIPESTDDIEALYKLLHESRDDDWARVKPHNILGIVPVRFKPYHRGAVPDSRDVPPFGETDGYAFVCPKCDSELVHVIACRMIEGPYDGRLCAEIALQCEMGCETTIIFGNYKGCGYCHWVEGIEWTGESDRIWP